MDFNVMDSNSIKKTIRAIQKENGVKRFRSRDIDYMSKEDAVENLRLLVSDYGLPTGFIYKTGNKQLTLSTEKPKEKEVSNGQKERKPKYEVIEVDGKSYTRFMMGNSILRLPDEKLKKMKMEYCIAKKNINQICLDNYLSREDFFFVKTALGWTKSDIPFMEEEIKEKPIDELVDITLAEKKKLYNEKLQNKDYDNMVKELGKYRIKDFFYNKVLEALQDININIHKDKDLKVLRFKKNESVLKVNITDMHIGMKCNTDFNIYNKEVAEERLMHIVLPQLLRTITRVKPEKIIIDNLGDCLHGIIHTSNRIASDMNIIASIKYATELLGSFISSLCANVKDVPIEYYHVPGNHGRIIGDKHASISDENLEELIIYGLQNVFKDSDRVKIVGHQMDNMSVIPIFDYHIVSIHGHETTDMKRLPEAVKVYDESANVLEIHSGHLHQEKLTEYNRLCHYITPSFCACDEWASSKFMFNRGGVRFIVYSPEGREGIRSVNF